MDQWSQCIKLVIYKEYSCFDHSDFPAHSLFTFDVCWGSLSTCIFGNSSSVANNIRSNTRSNTQSLDYWFNFFWTYTIITLVYDLSVIKQRQFTEIRNILHDKIYFCSKNSLLHSAVLRCSYSTSVIKIFKK